MAVFPALSDAVIVTLCSPHVNSLPFILFVPNKWTPTLSVTVTPGKNIFVNFSLDVLRMSSGHFAILGGSRSARVFFSDKKRETGFYATLCTSFSSRSSKFAIIYMALLTLLILAVCSNTWSYQMWSYTCYHELLWSSANRARAGYLRSQTCDLSSCEIKA